MPRLFLGLGTGLGSVPIIERRVGRKALKKIGKKAWRRRVCEMVPPLQRAFLADHVVLGGGNASGRRSRCHPAHASATT